MQPGTYDVLFSRSDTKAAITGVKITANKILRERRASAGVMMEEAEVVEYTVPLIDKDGGNRVER